MPALPTSEPDRFTAGESVSWRKVLPEYPAGTYTLEYTIQRAGALITFAATADGTAHLVTIPASDSANYAPGVATLVAYVETAAGQRWTVKRSSLTILPSPLAALGTTHASRMLGLIEAALEGRIPNGLQDTDIDGQAISRIPIPVLERLQLRYMAKVEAEQRAARVAAGRGNGRTIYTRFRSVR